MKRRSGASTTPQEATARLTSLRSSADPAVTLFKLEEDPDFNFDEEPRSSAAPPAKRVKLEAEVVDAAEAASEERERGSAEPELELELRSRSRSGRLAARAAPAPAGKSKSESKGKGKGTQTPSDARASPQKTKTKKPAKAIKRALESPHAAPAHWRETYDAIREMRARFPAPVDTMGCDTAKWKEMDPRNKRFATLVSLMLSSQTKDEVTDAAVDKLRAAFGGTLSLDALLAAEEHVIAEAINKAAQRLRDDFGSDVPKTVDELCSLPGVGPKMAFLCLHAAWDINVGIGVDVHVHRITNRLKWHKPPTKTAEETRLNLQSWLPTEFHKEINHLLVGFGQVICLPVGPRCDLCTLSTRNICPSAQATVAKSRTKRTAGPKIEIAIEEQASMPTLDLPPKDEPASPPLSAVSSLTPEPDDP